MTEVDWFEVRGTHGIELVFSTDVAASVKDILTRLARRDRGTDRVWRRAFPDAHPTRVEALAFRDRHERGMRSDVLDAVGRILARWPADGRFPLDHQGVDDWVVALANARWLFVDRQATSIRDRAVTGDADSMAVLWLQSVQAELVRAAIPELDSVGQ